jgi:hypothetical protein
MLFAKNNTEKPIPIFFKLVPLSSLMLKILNTPTFREKVNCIIHCIVYWFTAATYVDG